MRNVTPPPPKKFPAALAWTGVGALVIVLCVVFPRVLAFVELAARELRYFWWLILLVALAGYFFFFFGKRKN